MPETLAPAIALAPTRTHSPLAAWHLLSLDAPTVATLWLIFVAHTTRTTLAPLLPPAMFLAVWIIYAADRLLDSTCLEARHRFHQRYRTGFLTCIAAASAGLFLLLVETHLPRAYFLLGAVFLVWFAAVHLPRVPASARLPKELVTGIIFAAAVFAPELPQHLPAAFAFALLCSLNCAWITHWETPHPVHALTRLLLRWLPKLTAGLLLAGLFASPLAAAIALAAAALLALNHFQQHLRPTTLRAAADLALLTPILFLLFAR